MNRRGFLKAFGASFVAVDAISRGVMMPVKELILPSAGIQHVLDIEKATLFGSSRLPLPVGTVIGDILFVERPNGYNETVTVVSIEGNGFGTVRCMNEFLVPQSEASADTRMTKIGCTIDESSLGLLKT